MCTKLKSVRRDLTPKKNYTKSRKITEARKSCKKGRNQRRMCALCSPAPTNVNSAVWPTPTHKRVAQVHILFPHAFETTEKQKQIVTVMLHTLFSFFIQFIYEHLFMSVEQRGALRYEFMMDIQRAADDAVVVIIIIIIFIHIAAVAATMLLLFGHSIRDV